jgi:DNA integrity scanning protein DisA with diadenylate cyclase activity
MARFFMWDYQSQFQALAERAAKSLFSELDPAFSPRVFLVGLLQSHRPDQHTICVEPEEISCSVDSLTELLELHESMGRLVVSKFYTEERAQLKNQHELLRTTLLGLLEQSEADKYKFFCSHPGAIDDYLVFTVLQLDKKFYESQPRLCNTPIFEGETLEVSLTDSAIGVYLAECPRLLSPTEPIVDDGDFSTPSEVLRTAGNRLMLTPERLKGNKRGDLFQTCANIASLKYEGEEGTGRIVIAEAGHESVQLDISFLETVELRSYRAVRKLLQLAASELCLISDGEKILGLGRIKENYEVSQENLFVIRFVRHHVWEVRHGETALMRVSYGEPRLSKNRFNETKFKNDILRIFPDISHEDIKTLSHVAFEASKQKNGTLLVITKEAKAEADRLKRHCARISPTKLTSKLVGMVTGIDGAVILDTTGICFAIGAILDGNASRFGTSARGARFNSAIRYVDSREHPCFALVVSEDGTVDFIPDMMPEEESLIIDDELERLRKLFTAKSLDPKLFYAIMDWFDSHRRYLSDGVCSELNWLQERFLRMLPSGSFRIVYPEFVPDGLMHELG